jgi:hypothetical protein
MDDALEDAAFALNPHAVLPALGLGDASWPRLALQLGWVVLAQALATLGCSACPVAVRGRARGRACVRAMRLTLARPHSHRSPVFAPVQHR